MQERVRELELQVDRLGKDVDRLSGWVELLLAGARRIERSRTWVIGRVLVDNARRFTGRPRGATPFREFDELHELFEHWKKSRD